MQLGIIGTYLVLPVLVCSGQNLALLWGQYKRNLKKGSSCHGAQAGLDN